MGEEGIASTLVGRKETHGEKYPGILEKFGMLATIVAAILVGQWIWTQSDWPAFALWPSMVCGLPLATLFVAEIIAKFIQRIHIGNQ